MDGSSVKTLYILCTFLAFPPQTDKCEEVLPVAEAAGPRVLSAEEQRRLAEQEENTLRELRLFLRDVTKRLATDKRFNIFSKPVDIEEVEWNWFVEGLTPALSNCEWDHKLSVYVSGVRLPGGD